MLNLSYLIYCLTIFPESNHMLTLDNHDPLSGIPGYKSIPVELEPSN